MARDLDEMELEDVGTRGWGSGTVVGSVLVAAAIGAGAALLLAPETGAQTRRMVSRRLRELHAEADDGVDQLRRRVRHRRERRRRETRLAAVAAVLVGLGVAALFTPNGASTRRKLGRKMDTLREGASRRLYDLQARRDAARSRNGDPLAEPARPVRTVQELGRDAEDVL